MNKLLAMLLLIGIFLLTAQPAFATKAVKSASPQTAAASNASKLLIYYGIPQGVNGLWNDEAAGTLLARFDYLVLGAGLEESSHTFHSSTKNVLSVIRGKNPKTIVFGYIDLGVSTNNYTADVLRSKVLAWKAMGANGIFLDDAGYDYQVSRSRLNQTLKMIHEAGMPAFVNAWFAKDVMGNEPHEIYNPTGEPTQMGSNDYYLLESFFVSTNTYANNGGYATAQTWKKRGDQAVAYRKSLGVKLMGIDSADFSRYTETALQQYFQKSEMAAGIFSLDGYGLSASQYSASSSNRDIVKLFPYRADYSAYYNAAAPYKVNLKLTKFERGPFVLQFAGNQ